MVDLGVIFRPQRPPEELRAAAEAADESGVDELWLWEDCFDHGGLATAAAALAWTERVRVGIGVLPVPLRNVALAAMEIASVHRLFPGRLEVGIGHGVQDWMAQVGEKPASPMTLLREYTVALRALLDGEQVSTSGRYVFLDGVTLAWPPPSPAPRVQVGAVGPKTVALAGEVGDGLVLTGGQTPAEVRAQRERYDVARGHRPGRVTAYLACVTGADSAARYAAEVRSWNLDPARDVGVHGDAHAVADAVLRWADAGADSVVLQPPPDTDPVVFARFAGDHVRPLLG